MHYRKFMAAAAALFLAAGAALAQEAVVSKKQDVAVFALGYYGYAIPQETLATVDAEIQGVFVNLGRFNVLGQTARLTTGDVQTFIDTLRKAKESNTPLPDEIKFGEVQLTEAVLNKLYGAFVVVVPTVTDFNSGYNDAQKQYETTLKTSVAFINVAEGTTFGFANITTQGSSKETQYKSIKQAVDGIAFQLSYEIRRIPAFTINTRVLQVKGGEIKMQLGADMGVVKGDEYVVLEKSEVAGFADEREAGLVLIREVGPQVSTGTVLYADRALVEGAQLREIPRAGIDVEPYFLYLNYFEPLTGWKSGDYNVDDPDKTKSVLAFGARFAMSRGFYELKPIAGVQINLDTKLWLPIISYFGGEYNAYFGRFGFSASAAFAVGTNIIVKLVESQANDTDDKWFTHLGCKADAGLSYLVSRNTKVFAKIDAEYLFGLLSGWVSGPFVSYGGYGLTGGVAFKL